MSDTYFQKGFGLKASVGPVVAQSYRSGVVERLKQLGYDATAGDLRVKLAREFGFCYGVDRAVQYLVVAIFASDEGHHVHDSDPRFEAWNKRADAYQVEEPFVFGGDTIVEAGP